ncbi:alpha/beta hydrolase [Entomoplasma ellychniae]|uniref:Alpha/beta hydrolase n=1 Tax=Entomoplasma ellychniae TaxID=2114 RepID=A0A8E2U9R1_9MOLU|nr:alpha/beta fold hydrolase [Entomoplasma ellychniae]PPE04409.1 alpha/beta hydrolase [Entomoplasma ellychniae]
MGKIYKKINLKMGNIVFKTVNKNLISFYNGIENLTRLKHRNSIYFPEIKKMNSILDSFHKTPKLKITVSDNLIPFKFETEDGVTLSGIKYITNHNSKKWIVSLHWFAGHKYWGLYNARVFIELGYNVVSFDFRNHGESEKVKHVTMGLNESKDFLAIMKWLQENHQPETIGLLGVSMGSFVINYGINTYNEEFKKYNVKFAICDSGYGSISTLLLQIRNFWLKKFIRKKRIQKFIQGVIKAQSEDTGVDWNNIDVFKFYDNKKIDNMFPMFIMHSRDDIVTPFDDSLKLFIKRSIHSRDDEILIYDSSRHALSLRYHFKQTVYRWLKFENKIMKDDEATRKALEYFDLDKIKDNDDFDEKVELNTFYLNSSDNKDVNEIK